MTPVAALSESRLQQLLGDLQTVHLHTRLRQEPMWNTTKEKLPDHGESAVQPYNGLLPNADITHLVCNVQVCAADKLGEESMMMNQVLDQDGNLLVTVAPWLPLICH